MAHKTRELLIKQRTMSVNALLGHLAEFGVIAAKGISNVEELVERAAAADVPAMVQTTLGVLLAQLRALQRAHFSRNRHIKCACREVDGHKAGDVGRRKKLTRNERRFRQPRVHIAVEVRDSELATLDERWDLRIVMRPRDCAAG